MGKILTTAILALMSVAILLAGCNSAGCTDNQTSVPLAGFYSYTTGQALALDSVEIGGVGAPHDSLLHSKGSVKEIYLPLRPGKEATSFFLRYTNRQAAAWSIADTVTFDYTTIPYFVSEDCGAMYRYQITRVSHTHWLLDSVAVLDSTITNADFQRIQFYYTTSTQP
ncbi:MAG: DUF6452 family protein [Pseudoflavonifractor sp.]|nr:DUF6452 family protein [Alloprevotella sp.]MCM1116779.1 DUF6452 family protein [Pseudoflavonifractor sp.]